MTRWTTTSRSRCPSPRATGSAPRCSKRSASLMPRRSIATTSPSIRTTAGRCSACSRRSRRKARRIRRSTRTSRRAGRARTPGFGLAFLDDLDFGLERISDLPENECKSPNRHSRQYIRNRTRHAIRHRLRLVSPSCVLTGRSPSPAPAVAALRRRSSGVALLTARTNHRRQRRQARDRVGVEAEREGPAAVRHAARARFRTRRSSSTT